MCYSSRTSASSNPKKEALKSGVMTDGEIKNILSLCTEESGNMKCVSANTCSKVFLSCACFTCLR